MTDTFTADEVFEMAERIEQNAADFYREAATVHADKADVAFLRDLARMEDEHKAVFAAMRKELPPQLADKRPFDDPFLKATLFLDRIADAHGGEGTFSAASPMSKDDSLEELVKKAIQAEQKTVLFYVGISDRIPDDLGKDRVDVIISEEKSHITLLAEQLKQLKQAQ
jgi:rubrerythrin